MTDIARQIEHARRARETAAHGAPLTEEERIAFRCQQSAMDAEAWRKRYPDAQPQLDLPEAA
jgi:hypothetical protein